MKPGWKSTTQQPGSIVELDDYRQSVAAKKVLPPTVRVMVEVACNDPLGDDIRIDLARCLEDLGYVTVSDHRPDWVFSIIAFPYGNLVELSVVLRQLFRSTAPGTEMVKRDCDGNGDLPEGGWVYESLRLHSLNGVPKSQLPSFLKSLAKEFARRSLARVRDRQRQP
jgi:hypothetical protein